MRRAAAPSFTSSCRVGTGVTTRERILLPRRGRPIMLDARVEILLVEDNPNDEKLTLLAFKSANLGNTVHVARDGVQALEFLFGETAAARENPKLILLDLKLPKVDGLEV